MTEIPLSLRALIDTPGVTSALFIARFLFNSGFGEGWALYAERSASPTSSGSTRTTRAA